MNVLALLHEVLRRERQHESAWGTHDCLCWCAACALEMLHRDPIAHLRGRYDSEVSAKRLMLENGWHTLGDVAASLFPEIPVAQARSGDWAFLAHADGTESLGVVARSEIWGRGPKTLGIIAPLTAAQRAFRVQ